MFYFNALEDGAVVHANSKASLQLNQDRAEDSFSGRLKELIGPNSVRAFAKEVGIGQTTIQKYLAGAMPGLENLVILAKRKGVTMDWLATGDGPKHHGGSDHSDEGSPFAPALPSDFRLIPRLEVTAAAGPGSIVEYEQPVEMLAFRADWLRSRGINPLTAHVLTARGDSMEPTIRDGDILLVDSSIDRVMDNAIYVLFYAGRTLVKRVQLRLDGSVVLKSDNKDIFDDEAVPAAEVAGLNVAGRVMWYGRSI